MHQKNIKKSDFSLKIPIFKYLHYCGYLENTMSFAHFRIFDVFTSKMTKNEYFKIFINFQKIEKSHKNR